MVTHTHLQPRYFRKQGQQDGAGHGCFVLQADLARGQGCSLANPWQVDIRVADPRHSSHPCYHGYRNHGRMAGKEDDSWRQAHSSLEYENSVLGQ